MVFSSTIFLFLFLPIVLVGNLILKRNIRNLFLVLASLLFYMWGAGDYVPLLIFLIVFNWYAGIVIASATSQRDRRRRLIGSILVTLGGLIYFKYTDFLIDNINALLGPSEAVLKIAFRGFAGL
jgi:alginate O-acetyltransferase complex protein AlgI